MAKNGKGNGEGPKVDRALMASILKARQDAYATRKFQDFELQAGDVVIIKGKEVTPGTFTDKDTQAEEVIFSPKGTIVGIIEGGDDTYLGKTLKVGVFTTRERDAWKIGKFYVGEVLEDVSGNLAHDLEEAHAAFADGHWIVKCTQKGEYLNTNLDGQPSEEQLASCIDPDENAEAEEKPAPKSKATTKAPAKGRKGK